MLPWVLLSGVIAGFVTLPLALWEVRAFVHSVVMLQFGQPLRMDALSFLPWLKGTFGVAPTWLAFIAAGGVIFWTILRFPRTPAGFALAVAMTFLIFFALNKQAFCNYYFFVIGAMCCALAAQTPEQSTTPPIQPATAPQG